MFALVEAAVVSYLRLILITDGNYFPLKEIPPEIYGLELSREAATLIMLIAIGFLTGATILGRLGAFMLAFGTWDIFYYIWLVFFEEWPTSIMDWDLLFLIPAPWIAPVMAPVLVSIGLIGCGLWLLMHEWEVDQIKITMKDVIFELTAAIVILFSFLNNDRSSPPESFPWIVFLTGLLGGVSYFIWRIISSQKDY